MSRNQLEILRQQLITQVNLMNEQELNELIAFWNACHIVKDEGADDAEQEVAL